MYHLDLNVALTHDQELARTLVESLGIVALFLRDVLGEFPLLPFFLS